MAWPRPDALRVLVIAEAANPELVSVPLVGWSHARAIAERCDAHIVTQVRNREAFLRAGLEEGRDFTAIDSEAVARRVWKLSKRLRGGAGRGWTTVTALAAISYAYFERLLWRQLGARIQGGDFDLVHRLTPLSPTTPSRIARRCSHAGVPFVLGPLNGGLPWPRDFDKERRREREWLSYVRGAYRLLPGHASTLHEAAALIVGSGATWEQMPRSCREKCVYIPENAIDPERFHLCARGPVRQPLRVAFLGRLVPYKGADMLLEAALPLLRAGRLRLDIIGDGPEMPTLRARIREASVEAAVTLDGWVPHERVQERLVESDVFGFPSVREFGGGAVLEAMALGLAPIVVDYGGPAELVGEASGWRVPLGPRATLVEALRKRLEQLVLDPGAVRATGEAARRRVFRLFTWSAKAERTLQVYRWAVGKGPKPEFPLAEPDEPASSGPGIR